MFATMANLSAFVKDKMAMLFGIACMHAVLIFIIASIPVYLYRAVVVILTKLFRPDLEIFNGQSGVFTYDLFAKTHPRANILVTILFQGHVSLDEAREFLLKNWVMARDDATGKLKYERLQKYAVQLFGFTFWKRPTPPHSFSIDKHVHLLYGEETLVNDDLLTEASETLLNSHLPLKQSPWEVYLIENYKNPKHQTYHSAVIVKFHHSFSDGYGIMSSFIDGLFQTPLSSIKLPEPRYPQRSFWEQVWYYVTIPVNTMIESSQVLSHIVRNSPWKILDERKEWHQVCAKAVPIPIQDIKDIKNAVGVSFTSVLVSAINSAIQKSFEGSKTLNAEGRVDHDPVLFLSAFPLGDIKSRRDLSVHATAAVFEVPCKKIKSPIERLKKMHKNLESKKNTVVPYAAQWYSVLMGSHLNCVVGFLTKNWFVSFGLSNFPGLPENLTLEGRVVAHCELLAGAAQGTCGMGIFVISHSDEIRIAISVEKALLSKEEAKQFVKFLNDEIHLLHGLVMEKHK